LGLRIFHEYRDGSAAIGVVYFLGGGFLELSRGGKSGPGKISTLWLQVPDVGQEETAFVASAFPSSRWRNASAGG
jgi:hypothetical protein